MFDKNHLGPRGADRASQRAARHATPRGDAVDLLGDGGEEVGATSGARASAADARLTRKLSLLTALHVLDAAFEAERTHGVAACTELITLTRRCFARLPESERQLVALYYASEAFTWAQAADALGLSVSSCKRRFAHAVELLATEMTREPDGARDQERAG